MDLKNQFPGDPEPTQVTDDMRIDNWGRGGPGGSNWNASDLLCSIEGTTTCAAGELIMSIWAGEKLAGRKSLKVAANGAFFKLLQVPQGAWFDQRVNEQIGDLYETVTFRSTVTLKCDEPYKSGPQHTLPEEHAAHAFFVAGFAFGE